MHDSLLIITFQPIILVHKLLSFVVLQVLVWSQKDLLQPLFLILLVSCPVLVILNKLYELLGCMVLERQLHVELLECFFIFHIEVN